MTTNQTIDGVPREQVERALDAIEQVGLQDKFIDYTFVRTVKHELRALLDARESCGACNGCTNGCRLDAESPPATQPQGEPVALFESVIGKNPQAFLTEPVYQVTQSEVREFARLLAEQPAPDNALKAFASDMINAAFEGGSFEGGDIQDIAVKHGLLRIEQREEECGEVCACRSEGDGFPAACYRKTALLRGEQPEPVAVVHTMRSIMEAVERSSEFTVLTSNQCAALAAALNTK